MGTELTPNIVVSEAAIEALMQLIASERLPQHSRAVVQMSAGQFSVRICYIDYMPRNEQGNAISPWYSACWMVDVGEEFLTKDSATVLQTLRTRHNEAVDDLEKLLRGEITPDERFSVYRNG